MKPATWPREAPLDNRLLVIDPRAASIDDAHVRDLVRLLRAGDLLVVNDAATLPASLHGRTAAGVPVEVRLAARADGGRWTAVLFGEGDWRTRTEDRPPPPEVAPGARLVLGGGLGATVEALHPLSPRLVDVRFDCDGAALWTALHRHGRPVQYAYVRAPLEPWHVQTAFASRPWAVEMPSAGRPLTWELLLSLRRAGVGLASVTHAAGLSSTGDPRIDAALPLPERFDIPARTVEAIVATKRRGGRVVATGTTVVRAVEGCAAQHGGDLRPGEGVTDLRIAEGFTPRWIDGLLTGMHVPGESHFDLLRAFAPAALLCAANDHAERAGYLAHELGDSTLVLAA